MDEYETVLLVKPEVFVYKIPPRTTNRGYRAADWKLDAPDWTGRMRIVSKGENCIIKLEDKTSGELFSKSPIDEYPGIAIEAVMDSSRYFVLRIQDDNGRTAFVGIGFADRGDSFDLNIALQEHFKWAKKTDEGEASSDSSEAKPSLDLSFKDGQTITINMNLGNKSGSAKPRPKPSSAGGIPGLLPPPPGGIKIPPPSARVAEVPAPSVSEVPHLPTSQNSTASAESNLLLEFDSLSQIAPPGTTSTLPQSQTDSSNLWGDFALVSENPAPTQQNQPQPQNWMDF